MLAQNRKLKQLLHEALERLEAGQPPRGGRTWRVVNKIKRLLHQISPESQ